MKWIHINEADIPTESGIRKVKIGGKSVCLIRDADQVYVTSVRCPHAGADLSGGWCAGGKIICPYHRHAFSLETGRGDQGQGNYIHVYPTEKRADGWYVGVKASWWSKLLGSRV